MGGRYLPVDPAGPILEADQTQFPQLPKSLQENRSLMTRTQSAETTKKLCVHNAAKDSKKQGTRKIQ